MLVEPYSSVDQAFEWVNESEFGLQAAVFTNDLTIANRAFEELEVGGVILNDSSAYRVDHMPYGGVKNSGFGREGVRYAMEEMTERRILAVRIPSVR
jgi:acyl-CoA reductase-like NAD-dependent aldehyde dehydrogenase